MSSLTLQAAFTSGELSPSLSARVDMAKYQQGCRTLLNFKVQPHGGAVKRPGFLLLDSLPGEAALIRFVFNNEQAYALAFGEKWLRIFTAEGPVLDKEGAVFQIETPYTLAQARSLSVAQSADVLFIACRGVVPYKLMRRYHTDWRFVPMTFDPPLAAPEKPTVSFVNNAKKSDGSASAAQLVTPYAYYVSAVDGDQKESEMSPVAKLTGPAVNNWQGGDYVVITWAAVDGAKQYRIYKSSFGGRPGYIAAISELTYHDYNITPSLTEGAPKYEDPFPENDYPGLVGFFEQRLIFASSPNRPQTIWTSKSGDYLNFAKYEPLTDDAPMELTIASREVSPMCWMAALRSLVLGATAMEWEVYTSQDQALSAKSARVRPQSYIGSATLPAIIIGNTVLHVARSGAQVRNLKYDFGADSYGGTDCSILASHLTEQHRIVDWTYQQHPDSVVWAVRSDGTLLGMTYQSEHEVFAWHRHRTQGAFKSICSVPDGAGDALFAVVKRGERYFMEMLAEQYIDGDYARHSLLDCSLIYDDPEAPVAALSGLEHLEGMTVGILADGAVCPSRVVEDGRVALDRLAGRVIVGLEYVADLETMPVEIVGQEGASVGRKKQINAVSLLFHRTVGAKVGTSFDRMEIVKWRSTEPHGRPPRPYSGTKNLVIPTLAENVVSVCVRSDEPTPMTVLAIMPQLDVK